MYISISKYCFISGHKDTGKSNRVDIKHILVKHNCILACTKSGYLNCVVFVVFRMWTVCVSYVLRMLTVCSLSVLRIFFVLSSYVQLVFERVGCKGYGKRFLVIHAFNFYVFCQNPGLTKDFLWHYDNCFLFVPLFDKVQLSILLFFIDLPFFNWSCS